MSDDIILEIKKAEKKIGKDALLQYIKKINSNTNFEYNLIIVLVSQYFELSEIEILKGNKSNAVDAKKIIAYLLYRKTTLSNKQIYQKLNITDRTLRRYKKDIFTIIVNPKLYPKLYKSYSEILQMFNEKIINHGK